MKVKTLLTAVVLVGILSCAPFLYALAKPAVETEVAVPIDGGISLLVAAGVAYGAKKAYDKRKNEKQQEIK